MAEREKPKTMSERVRPQAPKPKAEPVKAEVEVTEDEDPEVEEPDNDVEEPEDGAEDGETGNAQGEGEGDEEVVVGSAPKAEAKKIAPPPVGVKNDVIPDTQGDEDRDPDLDKLSDHILDTPQSFGIWIGGKLHTFRKGRQRLTNEQKDACLSHRYVRDNGASVIKLVKSKVAPAKK